MIPTLAVAVSSLQPWVDAGVFGLAEAHGASVITRTHDEPLVHLAAAFALWAPVHGHACIDLCGLRQLVDADRAAELAAEVDGADGMDSLPAPPLPELWSALPWPEAGTWIDVLRASSAVRTVDGPDRSPVLDEHPLVLWGALLFTQRQWIDECSVGGRLLSRAATATTLRLGPPAADLLELLLPSVIGRDGDDDGEGPRADTDGTRGEADLQHVAARAVLSSKLTVIVGGPGTGKTHTIARTLAVMLEDARGRGTSLRIGLAAPTGKAAARMREAIESAASAGRASGSLTADQADELVALPTSTIHKLLGWRGSATRFVHSVLDPLPDDVVIIDEASMVALPLMARLMEAVRPDANLVLVGDPDQLHSIEHGAVLADIVAAAATPTAPLHERVIRLRRPRRQQLGSPLGPLADLVRDDRPAEAVAMLRAGACDPRDGRPLLTFIEQTDVLASADRQLVADVVSPPLLAAAKAARAGDATAALTWLSKVRVLCAHRRGPAGAESWNRAIETWVLGPSPPGESIRFPTGRALLVTRNDQRQHLANGDTGIVVADPAGVRAAFATAAGLRLVAPAQLDRLESAFATTIHKSQGSEYETVVVVVPPESSPLIGRELLYTAITRATDRLVVVGTAAAVMACIGTPSRRVNGLTPALASFR